MTRMKRWLSLFLIVSLVAVPLLVLPASAKTTDDAVVSFTPAPEDDKPILLRYRSLAYVLSNRGDEISVWFSHPQKMEMKEGDSAENIYTIPMDGDTEFFDEDGEKIKGEDILPGQRIYVTFLFHWENSAPRQLRMLRAETVELREPILPVRDEQQITMPELLAEENTLYGTIVRINRGKQTVDILVHGGFFKEPGGTYYYSKDRQFSVSMAEATITDSKGKVMDIKPLQTVKVVPKDVIVAERFPPMYNVRSLKSITVLDNKSDKILTADVLQTAEILTGTVKKKTTEAEGNLVVHMAPDSWQKELQSEVLLQDTGLDKEDSIAVADLTVGDTVEVWYDGISLGTSPGKISWYHKITKVK